MPHTFNTDGVREKLFILQNLAHASEDFCRLNKIKYGGENQDAEFNHEYYFWMLKSVVSENLIAISITLRMLTDTLAELEDEIEINFPDLDKECCKGLEIADQEEEIGKFKKMNLRGALNKIIHATDITFVWDAGKKGRDYEFWNGKVMLHGKKGDDAWKVLLDVTPVP